MSSTIRIEGRGPVALALRLLLEREGIPAGNILADPIDDALPDWLGSRALALSLGSLQALSRIAPRCAPAAILESPGIAAPIQIVDVTRERTSGGARIEAAGLGVPMLGAVFRYSTLHRMLREAVSTQVAPISSGNVSPSLTVIADGETDPSTAIRKRDFGQVALLAEVEAERDQPGWAYERFTAEGPLALLPLPEARRRALVWCAPEDQCRSRAALDEAAFGQTLERAFGPLLGRLRLRSARHLSPVTRRIGPLRRASDRVAIGNAAQSLHPVAGQGLNLGLRDAVVLARQLGDANHDGRPLPDALDRFVASRQTDREVLVAGTDLLASITRPDLLRPLHGASLSVIDLCTPLRHTIARALMFGLR